MPYGGGGAVRKQAPHRHPLTVLNEGERSRWGGDGFPFRPAFGCGRDKSSEESALSYGDLFRTKGKSTRTSCLLMAQNIIRNDEGVLLSSLVAPNSDEKIAPNNGSWPLLVSCSDPSNTPLATYIVERWNCQLPCCPRARCCTWRRGT